MLELGKQYVDQMIAHALEDNPNECCGFITGRKGKATKLYRMTNTAASPYRYDMDPKKVYEVLQEARQNRWDPDPLVIYHSHTHSPAYPSATDVRIATWDGVSTWPDTYYVLISLMDHDNPVVRAYRITDGQVTEEELRAG
ncbi:MAG: M67 family metallopeptidase [Dehalococcoidia bacterium]|nr:M67 family metallopeptidase [Dehalococcoidia bacterium]